MKKGFVIHHNGPSANCIGKPHSRCISFWNGVKAYHQQKWPDSNDIAYSFGVCPHGTRFVGRGWNKNQYAGGTDVVGHDDGPDSAWFSVLEFIGGGPGTGYPNEAPTEAMVADTKSLIAEGRKAEHCGTQVLPHNAFKVKPCPGSEFTVLAYQWNNRSLTTETPEPEEEDMDLIIDSPGNPALWVGGGNVKSLNPAQRSALRAIGVAPKQVDDATSDALRSLVD